MLGGPENQLALASAAPSTGRRAKSKFLSVLSVSVQLVVLAGGPAQEIVSALTAPVARCQHKCFYETSPTELV